MNEFIEYLKERIEYYDRLSETRNGFELACKGGKKALEDALEYFKELNQLK